jgi:hypothetical protein
MNKYRFAISIGVSSILVSDQIHVGLNLLDTNNKRAILLFVGAAILTSFDTATLKVTNNNSREKE